LSVVLVSMNYECSLLHFFTLCCLISTFWFWSDVWILKFWNIMSWSWCLWICHGDENH
jgi:hypothetical protein